MKISNYNQKLLLLLLAFGCMYILLPSQNSSIDAWAYAGNIKHTEDLLKPHHLLYSLFGWVSLQLVSILGDVSDVLAFMKIVNAVFAVFGLWVFNATLKRLSVNDHKTIPYTIIAGACFAWMRFATENETYILPVIFSLLGTLSFLKFTETHKNAPLIKSGFWAAWACLFHQIHFVWWLGLLLGLIIKKSTVKNYLAYLLPALIVPLFYYPAIYLQNIDHPTLQQIIRYIFSDFYAGNVNSSIGIENFYLTAINFIRSFIQIHGIVPVLIKNNVLFIIPAIVLGVLLFLLIKKIQFRKIIADNYATKVLSIIFFLHVTVAFFSVGNAEFMVMLPFLAIALFAIHFEIDNTKLTYFATFLLVWNLSFGLLPNHFYQSNNYSKWVTRLEKESSNTLFLVEEKALVENQFYYKTGNKRLVNLKYPPAIWEDRGNNPQEIIDSIDEYLDAGFKVYVDDIETPRILNRAQLLKSSTKNYYENYTISKTDSISTIFGNRYLFQLNKK